MTREQNWEISWSPVDENAHEIKEAKEEFELGDTQFFSMK